MQQLSLQLYGKTSERSFSEQLSTSKSVSVGPGSTAIELELAAPKGEKFSELRLDPDDKPSRFALVELIIRGGDGAEIYRWDGNPKSFGTMVDLQPSSSGGRLVLESTSNDPFIIIPLAQPQPRVVLSLALSSDLFGSDTHELAEAVLSLQGTLRSGLDDLAAEQEALEQAVTLNQAHARAEVEAVNRNVGGIDASVRQLKTKLGALERQFEARLGEIAGSVEQLQNDVGDANGSVQERLVSSADETREAVLVEVRDLWRSLRQQIEDGVDTALRERREREAASSASVQAEFDKLMQAVNRLAGSQIVLEQLRHELGVARDVDAVARVQQLKAELQAARERHESSFAARVRRPLRSLTRAFNGA